MTYYIYHIPGVKIGCTSNQEYRIKHQQQFNHWEILEEHTDIYLVSDREKELQRQYGYKVDGPPYWKVVELAKSKTIKKKEATKKNFAHAGKVAYANSTKRKEQRLLQFFNLLPNQFKVKTALEIGKIIKVGRFGINSYLNTDLFTKIKQCTYIKSNIYT